MPPVTRRFRQVVSLFLVGLFCLTSTNFAMAGVAAELQHEIEQSEPHGLPQGGGDMPCDHCCSCHSSSHLSSAPSAVSTWSVPAIASSAPLWLVTLFPPQPFDTFFRPPRIS